MEKLSPFPCTACGKCCCHVDKSEQTAFLDRGDEYFDIDSRLCSIYNNRPLICRIEDYYRTYLSNTIKWDKFVQINLEVCKKLNQSND